MSVKKKKLLSLAAAALLFLGAALCATAQSSKTSRRASRPAAKPSAPKTQTTTPKQSADKTSDADNIPAPAKKNAREPQSDAPPAASTPAPKTDAKATATADAGKVSFVYDFKQPDSFVTHIRIEHDAAGRGRITFERRVDTEAIIDPVELSPAALQRITSLWEALRFLDSEASYQAVKQFPHLGTVRLHMARGGRERAAEFNWTDDENASGLAKEYRNVAEQAMFVFEVNVSLENQPLELPKLLTRFERLLEIKALSDPLQLVPLLRSLETDERIPLIARNHAGRLLKKLEK